MNERRQLDLPDRRKNTYEELVRRLDEHTQAVEKRLHRFFMKALFIFAVIGISSAVALFGFSVVLSRIKETRQDFVRDTCRAQNSRHDNVTAYITSVANAQLAQAKNEAQRKAIKASLLQWYKLIDLQAPHQDCDRLAKVSTGDAKPPPPRSKPKSTPTPNKKESP